MTAKGYPLYIVSSFGNVAREDGGDHPKFFMRGGRVHLNLKQGSCWSLVQLHRIVAASFFEDDIDDYEINHMDGDRTNNAIWNLEVTTREENREHAYGMGLMKRPIRIRNLDTGEVYSSLNEAGIKLGLISAIHVPVRVRRDGGEFQRGGCRLEMVID
jgi:hypothetical protein